MKEEKAGRFFCSLFYCVNQTEKPLFSAVVFLLQLAPSDGYRRHLPRQAGTAYISCAFLFGPKVIYCFSKTNSFVPSFLSGGQNRNDDKRKNIM